MKKVLTTLILILSFAFVFLVFSTNVASVYSEDGVTESAPMTIGEANQVADGATDGAVVTLADSNDWQLFRQYVLDGKNTSGVTFKLVADLVFSDTLTVDATTGETQNAPTESNVLKIGDFDRTATLDNEIFNGILDGDNHTMLGLYMANYSELTSDFSLGLFESLGSAAKICNLTIKDSCFDDQRQSNTSYKSSATSVFAETNNGLIAGVTLENVYVGTAFYAGGFCSVNNGAIINCVSNAYVAGQGNVGGLCAANNGLILNTWVSGYVGCGSYVTTANYGSKKFGGLCCGGGLIVNSIFDGTIECFSTTVGTAEFHPFALSASLILRCLYDGRNAEENFTNSSFTLAASKILSSAVISQGAFYQCTGEQSLDAAISSTAEDVLALLNGQTQFDTFSLATFSQNEDGTLSLNADQQQFASFNVLFFNNDEDDKSYDPICYQTTCPELHNYSKSVSGESGEAIEYVLLWFYDEAFTQKATPQNMPKGVVRLYPCFFDESKIPSNVTVTYFDHTNKKWVENVLTESNVDLAYLQTLQIEDYDTTQWFYDKACCLPLGSGENFSDIAVYSKPTYEIQVEYRFPEGYRQYDVITNSITPPTEVTNIYIQDYNLDMEGLFYDQQYTRPATLGDAIYDDVIIYVKIAGVGQGKEAENPSDEPNVFTVSFVCGDFYNGTPVASMTVEAGEQIEPPYLSQEGLVFEGWYLDGKFADKAASYFAVTRNYVLFARWSVEEAQPFVIDFNCGDNYVGAVPNSLKVYQKLPDFLPALTQDGKTFVGWSASGVLVCGGDSVESDLTLVAVWSDEHEHVLSEWTWTTQAETGDVVGTRTCKFCDYTETMILAGTGSVGAELQNLETNPTEDDLAEVKNVMLVGLQQATRQCSGVESSVSAEHLSGRLNELTLDEEGLKDKLLQVYADALSEVRLAKGIQQLKIDMAQEFNAKLTDGVYSTDSLQALRDFYTKTESQLNEVESSEKLSEIRLLWQQAVRQLVRIAVEGDSGIVACADGIDDECFLFFFSDTLSEDAERSLSQQQLVCAVYSVELYDRNFVQISSGKFSVKFTDVLTDGVWKFQVALVQQDGSLKYLSCAVKDGCLVAETNELGQFVIIERQPQNVWLLAVLLGVFALTCVAYFVLPKLLSKKEVNDERN